MFTHKLSEQLITNTIPLLRVCKQFGKVFTQDFSGYYRHCLYQQWIQPDLATMKSVAVYFDESAETASVYDYYCLLHLVTFTFNTGIKNMPLHDIRDILLYFRIEKYY